MSKNKTSIEYKTTKGKGTIRPGIQEVNTNTNEVYDLPDIQTPVKAASDFDYISLGQTGITKHSIDKLAKHIGMSRKNVAEEIFDISVKTLERKATTDERCLAFRQGCLRAEILHYHSQGETLVRYLPSAAPQIGPGLP